MPQLRHFDNLGSARFITFSCHQRANILIDEHDIMIILDELKSSRNKYQYALLAYVVMPSHVHLVIHPTDALPVGPMIGEIKSRSARRILARWRDMGKAITVVDRRGETRTVLWEKRCYDHNCRTIETAREKIIYCHNNPVRAGLVAAADQWKWSSYSWYQGNGGLIEIDAVDLL